MNDLVVQFFGLDQLRPGDAGVSFGFARELPAWAWALVIVAAAGFAGWTYWRLIAPRAGRAALAIVRTITLVLLVLIISGPQFVRTNEHVERDWVVLLVDRSESMGVRDVETESGQRASRDEQLREAVRDGWPMLSALESDRHVLWLGFDAAAFDLRVMRDDGAQLGIDLGEPDGSRTGIGAAIDQALRRVAARPVSGVVLLSDGRSGDMLARSTLRRLQNELIPVFAVPLGSPEPLSDVAIRKAEAPRLAFVDDSVPVSVELRCTGTGEVGGATVRLIDLDTNEALDERRVEADALRDGSARVTLMTRPTLPGEVRWGVRVTTDRPDLIEENNTAEVSLDLMDDTLRVVYFDGYPRWEYRYVKNLLLRERSIDSSTLMLSPSHTYTQEGDTILATLPQSPEEWAEFDVVVLGDLRPEVFGEEKLEQLREHVAVRGGGLLWIAGPGAIPESWRGTPLADLLPFRDEGPVPAWDEPVTMAPTPAAERQGLLRIDLASGVSGWLDRLSNPATGWSQLRWAQRIDPSWIKPTAEVLATATPISEGASPGPSATPLVLTMRFGAGRIVYVGTDEVWRWRYGRGEALPERFWIPLIRHLGRESLALSGRGAVLEVTPPQAAVDQPVSVGVRLVDQALFETAPGSIGVTVERRGAGTDSPVKLTLGPDRNAGRADSFGTTWQAAEPGTYTIRVSDPSLASLGLEATLEVRAPGDELASPETDHAMLASLTEVTAGRVVPPDRIGELGDLLPNRSRVIPAAPDIETLWDRPIVLATLLVLLAVEWVGRRLVRLS